MTIIIIVMTIYHIVECTIGKCLLEEHRKKCKM
jgi:hypothetical protein